MAVTVEPLQVGMGIWHGDGSWP